MIFFTHWPQREAHSGRTNDISLSGMKFRTDTRLEPRQAIKLESPIIKAVARVARGRRQGADWELGVQFVSLWFARTRGGFIEDRI